MAKIVVSISTDGQSSDMEVIGAQGDQCREISKVYEEGFDVLSRVNKPEAYEETETKLNNYVDE